PSTATATVSLHDALPISAWKLLNDHRVGIELLRRALEKRSSPWLDVLAAVRATLPQLDQDDEVALMKLIAEGPPKETVGLDDASDRKSTRLNSSHVSSSY